MIHRAVPLPVCGHVTNGMGPCVLPPDHRTLHADEDGTEFSHSGKIGLGKIGPNLAAAWERARVAREGGGHA